MSFNRGGRGGFRSNSGGKTVHPIVDLPPDLKEMFMPRHVVPFVKAEPIKPSLPYTGIGSYVNLFEKTGVEEKGKTSSPAEAEEEIVNKAKQKAIQESLHLLDLEKRTKQWDPKNDPKATSDPFSTLFVSRLSYDINDKRLRREFEPYGAISESRVVTDLNGKSRGYGFVQFADENNLELALRKCDGKKIDNRRIVVDVERGRTVENWKPMRLGGGKGGRVPRKSKKTLEEEQREVELANRRRFMQQMGLLEEKKEWWDTSKDKKPVRRGGPSSGGSGAGREGGTGREGGREEGRRRERSRSPDKSDRDRRKDDGKKERSRSRGRREGGREEGRRRDRSRSRSRSRERDRERDRRDRDRSDRDRDRSRSDRDRDKGSRR